MAESEMKHGGGCLCGAVRYEIRGPLRGVIACHCSQCRRTSGHYVAMTIRGFDLVQIIGQGRAGILPRLWRQFILEARRR